MRSVQKFVLDLGLPHVVENFANFNVDGEWLINLTCVGCLLAASSAPGHSCLPFPHRGRPAV